MFEPIDGIELVRKMKENLVGSTVKQIVHRVDYKSLTIEFDTGNTIEFGMDEEGYNFFNFDVRDKH